MSSKLLDVSLHLYNGTWIFRHLTGQSRRPGDDAHDFGAQASVSRKVRVNLEATMSSPSIDPCKLQDVVSVRLSSSEE